MDAALKKRISIHGMLIMLSGLGIEDALEFAKNTSDGGAVGGESLTNLLEDQMVICSHCSGTLYDIIQCSTCRQYSR